MSVVIRPLKRSSRSSTTWHRTPRIARCGPADHQKRAIPGVPSAKGMATTVEGVTDQTSLAVMALWIYPTKDEPGVSLTTVEVEPDGLAGDRRKKSALHLVCAADAAELAPRANLVLDATADQLEELVGHRMTLGNSQIEITGRPSNCPGVYASVVRPGAVNIGDRLEPSADTIESSHLA